ncbi:response regulator transcription factor [Pseudarthrobacter phenanthrenivorans]|uniref:Transcriptional regulator n=1 Tax=Pseudarthrobacter phenanthrenivorans TaxID=361575 RepID=A0A0B4DZE5_PSEPS|nr:MULTISPECIES: response regulator transcription factor [Micrococcaceae]KIC69790.1 transcriptional regulator [Pseudarthrobacter phenanthrenivorans]MDJ0458106.1 response regulator transcription factor [Arthrobacter sp. NQ7]
MDVLIVEDDDAMAGALAAAVESAGHHPQRLSRGADALLSHRDFQVILLDLGLPDMDGLEVLRKLRQVTDVPILILTARDDERSVVLGLRSGADDYLVKPVKLVELLARIEAVTRRAGRQRGTPREDVIVLDDLAIDLNRHTASRAGTPLPLTATEFELLALLARHAGSVVTREQILDALWGDAFLASSRSLDVHLTGLRAKLQKPGFIINVRGVGYRVEAASG